MVLVFVLVMMYIRSLFALWFVEHELFRFSIPFSKPGPLGNKILVAKQPNVAISSKIVKKSKKTIDF